MKVIKILLIIGFCISIDCTSLWSLGLPDNCDKIEVKLETVNSFAGQGNGKVKVHLIKGDKKSIKYIFCEPGGKVLNENHFDEGSLEGLKKGEYLCIVTALGCTKRISFTIS